MSISHVSHLREPLVDGVKDLGQITRDVCDPLDAAPGTIRGDLATLFGENLIHGSDSLESAEREIAIFFPA